MKSLLFAFICLVPFGCYAQSSEFSLQSLFSGSGVTGTLSLQNVEQVEERCALTLIATLPSLFAELDQIGRSKGNMGSSRNRLYWVGPTRLRGVGQPGTILLTSRARYESWTYIDIGIDKIKTRNFRDTKTVDLSLGVNWKNQTDTLSLNYEIQNIRNFPGSIESGLRSLGVEFGGSAALKLEQSELTDTLAPELSHGPKFVATDDKRGLVVEAVATAKLPKSFLADSCIALQSLLKSQPERLVEFVGAMIEGL